MALTERSPGPLPLVLIVDHDDDTRSMYAQYLRQQEGCRTDEAADGRDALAKAISQHPTVIVTEVRLPGIDGVELCTILRRDALTRSIPIVVVTADGHPASSERARAAGADAVLIKPCLPDALLSEIRRVTAKSKALERAGDRRGATQGAALAMPPELVCPECDRPLIYQRSHTGGVSPRQREQWDYYACLTGCGTFQYRQRTRRLKKT